MRQRARVYKTALTTSQCACKAVHVSPHRTTQPARQRLLLLAASTTLAACQSNLALSALPGGLATLPRLLGRLWPALALAPGLGHGNDRALRLGRLPVSTTRQEMDPEDKSTMGGRAGKCWGYLGLLILCSRLRLLQRSQQMATWMV